jgi:2-keto-4-pentenoate hydratase/2-oxohepta-3-ene-1,7-dioic acid hydratase in catechol pathway
MGAQYFQEEPWHRQRRSVGMSDEGMRHHVVRCEIDGSDRWGVVEGNRARLLEGSPFGGVIVESKELVELDRVQLRAPAEATKIVCVGRNYVAHAAEHQAQVPAEPLLFLKPPSSLIGSGQTIVLPALSEHVEHEAELAVVIGSRCSRASEPEAWDHVIGVTCGNDVTARDLQRRDHQWTRGKGFDTFCPLGPYLVTGLAVSEVADLAISCRVGGEPRQQGRTRDMVFSPSFLISYISQVMTLMPGDVIMTGTPAGVGRLAPGDLVEVEIEGLGVLSNPVSGPQ